MRETRADTSRAIGLAVLLHALVLLVMFAGLWWTKAQRPPSAAGSPVSAELVDASDLSRAMQRTLANRPEPVAESQPLPEPVEEEEAPVPQPLPEPVPQEEVAPRQSAPQELLVNPDERNQDAVVDRPTPTPATETRVQEAKRRQEQVDLTEQKRQEEAERRQRLARQEQERQKQLAEIKRLKALAARDAKVAQAELQRIADARAAAASEQAARADASASGARAGSGGVDQGLLAQYIAALQAAINAKWTRPESVPAGAPCRLVIRQLPGGNVMDVQVTSPCAYDEAGQESIKRAVLKADPLPYAGFETVFNRNLTINFRAQDR
ncbi:cell envelope integrity protein TolA [Aerolutibacter ruishenii]|uniref:Colicin import membrane protein n=1 Tax=Aerolutibacter ruishenii TaxID=686800 RepID=A0A562M2E1_9GAMM|nr:cell envelope integrity protein TolA [Lysobacter ruishenii]TWI14117.1 colicin import membrane protein [Lysobacter ruishenii]